MFLLETLSKNLYNYRQQLARLCFASQRKIIEQHSLSSLFPLIEVNEKITIYGFSSSVINLEEGPGY